MATSADVTALITALTALTAAQQSNNNNSGSASFSKPEAFKGTSSADARRFLAHFESWAAEKADLQSDEPKKIKAALHLCTGGEAGIWSAPKLTLINAGTPPWTTWSAFKDAFKARWLAADEEAEALSQLKLLKQGPKQSVSDYAARFQDLAGRTKLEDHGKRTMFLDGLQLSMRYTFTMADTIAPAAEKSDTFEKTVTRCQQLDAGMNNPALGLGRGSANGGASRGIPVPDPMAMDVDASTTSTGQRTKEAYKAQMGRRCYGCGNSGHRIKAEQCPARNVTCRYCGRKAHFEHVCEDKFCGRARNRGRQGQGQRVNASNAAESFTLFPGEPLQTASTSAPALTPVTVNAATLTPSPSTNITAAQMEELNNKYDELMSLLQGGQCQDF